MNIHFHNNESIKKFYFILKISRLYQRTLSAQQVPCGYGQHPYEPKNILLRNKIIEILNKPVFNWQHVVSSGQYDVLSIIKINWSFYKLEQKEKTISNQDIELLK